MDDKAFRRKDSILDVVENFLRSLAKKNELKEVSVTRWRWDQPEVMLVWLQDDNIYRNIVAHVESEAGNYVVKFESNAWLDVDLQHGLKRVREWQHEPGKSLSGLKIPLSSEMERQLDRQIQRCYDQVRSLQRQDLKEMAKL